MFEASWKFWIFSWCVVIQALTQEGSWRGERSPRAFGTELWHDRFRSLTHNCSILMWVSAWYGMESRLLLGLQHGNKRQFPCWVRAEPMSLHTVGESRFNELSQKLSLYLEKQLTEKFQPALKRKCILIVLLSTPPVLPVCLWWKQQAFVIIACTRSPDWPRVAPFWSSELSCDLTTTLNTSGDTPTGLALVTQQALADDHRAT